MPFYKDQLGRVIQLMDPPAKIISLVPSQTELLYDLGLDKEIAGITKFCTRPQHWFRNKTRVGGTKQVNMEIIQGIQPDLIIANKEENDRSQVEELAKKYTVWISDVSTLEDSMQMIEEVGAMMGKNQQAKKIITEIRNKFSELFMNRAQADKQNDLSAAYFIWRNPYMVAGGDTFIHDMMKYCGIRNIFESYTRYPEINIGQLQIHPEQESKDERKSKGERESKAPSLLLLSSEPYPFTKKHIAELQPYLPGTKIILVDGEMFSWYGSRLLHAPAYFRQLLQEIQQ